MEDLTSCKSAYFDFFNHYCVQATLVPNQTAIESAIAKAGRFILATNVTDIQKLSNEQVLQDYKAQQSTERGFRFLKDPMFFTSSIFVKSPERVAAICASLFSQRSRSSHGSMLASL